ncbi:hypothetical protein NDU88_002877 [Pleurodeles waltl]|uniref:Secreted protein n=1 Tax=Pleurodeles waltl TaxID=8319 RepID=A0AAV7VBT7_PLEWA|nr:hypothetical protein NDU88_002877 [Pleurodeles waltl]
MLRSCVWTMLVSSVMWTLKRVRLRDDLGGFRVEWREADSLGSAGEEGGDLVQGSVADPCFVEVCAKGVEAGSVKGGREVQEDESSGFAVVK